MTNINFDEIKQAEKYGNAMFSEITDNDLLNELHGDGVAKPQAAEQIASDPNIPLGDQKSTHSVNMGFMNASFVINAFDTMMPAIVVWAWGMFMKRKLKPTIFKLTADEKATLGPIIEECLKTINMKMENPWVALLITTAIIYTSKFFMIDETSYKASVDVLIEKREQAAANSGTGAKRGPKGPWKNK